MKLILAALVAVAFSVAAMAQEPATPPAEGGPAVKDAPATPPADAKPSATPKAKKGKHKKAKKSADAPAS